MSFPTNLTFWRLETRGLNPRPHPHSRLQSRVFGLILLGLFLTLPGMEAGAQAKRGKVVIGGRVEVSVELARSFEEHAKGLSGRSGLKEGEGMLFVFDGKGPRSIWMKGMRFPLDILWIVDGRITALERHVPPPSPDRPLQIYTHEAEMVLEVPAGFCDEHRIQIMAEVKVFP